MNGVTILLILSAIIMLVLLNARNKKERTKQTGASKSTISTSQSKRKNIYRATYDSIRDGCTMMSFHVAENESEVREQLMLKPCIHTIEYKGPYEGNKSDNEIRNNYGIRIGEPKVIGGR